VCVCVECAGAMAAPGGGGHRLAFMLVTLRPLACPSKARWCAHVLITLRVKCLCECRACAKSGDFRCLTLPNSLFYTLVLLRNSNFDLTTSESGDPCQSVLLLEVRGNTLDSLFLPADMCRSAALGCVVTEGKRRLSRSAALECGVTEGKRRRCLG
jgi:hypothetical protein